jgi:hypothetical protein
VRCGVDRDGDPGIDVEMIDVIRGVAAVSGYSPARVLSGSEPDHRL